jgi:hypothetical protein
MQIAMGPDKEIMLKKGFVCVLLMGLPVVRRNKRRT